MSYRITFTRPFSLHKTEKKLTHLQSKIFNYGSTKFFSYNEKYFEIEEDNHHNIVSLTIHGNSVADYNSLMMVKNKLFLD
jgi:hypothetical protein